MRPTRTEDGRVVVSVWLADYPFPAYDGRSFLDPMRDRAQEFGRAHPEYLIDIKGHMFWTMAEEVARAAEEGDPPDVAGYYASAGRLARDTLTRDGRPLFTSVTDAIGGRTEILGEPVVTGDLEPALRNHYSVAGELLSLPATATTTVLFANKNLLDAAGVPEPPRTWDEVETACRAVARHRGEPCGITWPIHGWLFQQAVAAQGGLLTDNDNGRSGRPTRADFLSEEMMAWVNWWLLLHKDGHYLYTGRQGDWPGSFEAFSSERVAFIIDSSKSAEEIVQAGRRQGFEVEVTPMPRNGNRPYAGNAISGDSLWLAADLDPITRDGALAFMQYLINPRNAAGWHRANGFAPVTRASFDLLESSGWFAVRPHQRVATEQLRAADGSASGPLLGNPAGVNATLTQAMEDVLMHDAAPRERFARAAEQARRLLHEYNADCLVPRTPRSLSIG